MKYNLNKHSDKKNGGLKKYVVLVLGLLLVAIVVNLTKHFNSVQMEPNKGVEVEELPIPQAPREQSTPEITRLNPDSEVKETW